MVEGYINVSKKVSNFILKSISILILKMNQMTKIFDNIYFQFRSILNEGIIFFSSTNDIIKDKRRFYSSSNVLLENV